MPLHLAPPSRRRFLAASLAAGVGVLTWREAWAEEAKRDPDHWILLSDTHIDADRAQVVRGVKMANNLARAVAALTGLHPRPAGVLLNGDAAHLNGEAGDYKQLAELLEPLADAELPLHFTLGNHDHRDHFRAGLLRGVGQSPLEARQVTVIETPRVNWVLLDTLDQVNKTPGVCGKEQLDWLAQALDARADKPAMVVAHHDPQWTPRDKRTGLVDTEALFDVLRPRKQVKALIFGHTHHWHRDQRDGIHLVNLPPVAYVFTPGIPNGWVDVRLRDQGARFTLHAFDAKHRQNGETYDLAWR